MDNHDLWWVPWTCFTHTPTTARMDRFFRLIVQQVVTTSHTDNQWKAGYEDHQDVLWDILEGHKDFTALTATQRCAWATEGLGFLMEFITLVQATISLERLHLLEYLPVSPQLQHLALLIPTGASVKS